MKIALQVEGQRGLTWDRWQRFATAVEYLGFHGLYRSDHFLDSDPPDQESLALWPSLTWLASHTENIEFGPLVTPLSFRHPVHTARIAKDVDDLSCGRLVLGVGAGWDGGIREHKTFGFDLLETKNRFIRYEEGLNVIRKLLHDEMPVTFEGQYYQLDNAALLPKPGRKGGPPILVGGNGPKRVLPLAAKYADHWNAIFRTPDQFATLNTRLDELLQQSGRHPSAVHRSQMMGLVFGRDQVDLDNKLDGASVSELTGRGVLAGVPTQIIDQLGHFEEAGLNKVMLQWSDLDDLDGLEAFSKTVLIGNSN